MNKEEFLSKRYAIDLKLKELNGEREQLEKNTLNLTKDSLLEAKSV